MVNLYVHTCHEWDKWDTQNCYPLHRTTHKASRFCFETPRHKSDKLLITVTVPYWTISHVWRNPCIDYKRVNIVTNCWSTYRRNSTNTYYSLIQKLKDYSVLYFNHITVFQGLYLWTSVKSKGLSTTKNHHILIYLQSTCKPVLLSSY